LKPRHNHLSSTLVLKGVQIFEHKWKKEKMFPLEICEELLEEFLVNHKKWLKRHGGQPSIWVSKTNMKLKCLVLLEIIL
jgi:hypothetical protein